MLEFLRIKNLALIENMELEFSGGINVFTGETGAGKSFILKALNFVLGDKLSVDNIRPEQDKTQIEAIFTLDNNEILIKRELHKNGKSRIFINDNLATKELLKKYREELLYETSQHAQQQLLNPAFQAELLETQLNAKALLEQKDNLKQNLKELDSEVKALLEKQKNLLEKREILEIQFQEIEKVNPKQGEEEELEKIRTNIKEQENSRKLHAQLISLIHGDSESGLLQQLSLLEHIVSHLPDQENNEKYLDSILNFRYFISELEKSFKIGDSDHYDLDAVEARLFTLSQLKRKLKRSFSQILQLKEEINQSLSFLDAFKLDIMQLEKEKDKKIAELKKVVTELEPKRKLAAEQFVKNLEKELKALGFSKELKVVPDFQKILLWPGVFDLKGRILWAPNPGQLPQPLDRIASGGELSRFLLAITSLKKANTDKTYIFDEVDAGVGGLTLNKVGEKLEMLGNNRQIILITHWPQLAARATRHFHVEKSVRNGNTFTECKNIKGKEISLELERMAGGKEGKNIINHVID